MNGFFYVIGVILGIAIVFVCELPIGALLVWIASLCFGFTFKLIYAVGVTLIMMILTACFKTRKQLRMEVILTKRKEVYHEKEGNRKNF